MAQPTNGGDEPQAYTKAELLQQLRTIEDALYSSRVEAQVKQQPPEQIQAFAAARLHLTALIARLNASLMRDIREELDEQTEELRAGTAALGASLKSLQGAAGWAKAINGVIGLIGQVVPLL